MEDLERLYAELAVPSRESVRQPIADYPGNLVVEPGGIEPPTSTLRTSRSPG